MYLLYIKGCIQPRNLNAQNHQDFVIVRCKKCFLWPAWHMCVNSCHVSSCDHRVLLFLRQLGTEEASHKQISLFSYSCSSLDLKSIAK